ncbi:MAG: hypothetical protein FH749_10185 [Firmicutes bacterium]|nr:hypothetical protein [Bacillota bacterium]
MKVGAVTARRVLSIMSEIRDGQNQADYWLELLYGSEFAPLLVHCGHWEDGRQQPLSPERFLYILQNSWSRQGTFQLPPRQQRLERHFARAYSFLDRLQEILSYYHEYLRDNLEPCLDREVRPYLPESVTVGQKVELTLGTDQLAFVAGDIYLDLLGVRELGEQRVEQYVAHEVFHEAHNRLAANSAKRYSRQLFASLFGLQSEGVANHVIGGAREVLELRYKHSQSPERDQLLQRLQMYADFERAPGAGFEELFSMLQRAAEGRTEGVAAWFRKTSPGHYQGVAMADAIEEKLGIDALVATLKDPGEFVLAYAQTGAHVPPKLLSILQKISAE